MHNNIIYVHKRLSNKTSAPRSERKVLSVILRDSDLRMYRYADKGMDSWTKNSQEVGSPLKSNLVDATNGFGD